jgi:hypothetical protein
MSKGKGKGKGFAAGFGGGARGMEEGGGIGGLGFEIKKETPLEEGEADVKVPKAKDMEVNHFEVQFVWRPELRPAAPPPVAAVAVAAPGSAVAPSKSGAPLASPPTKK